MERPTLFLTIGLPGTGKTTAARLIEAQNGALRLTKDEWMKALFGLENPASASDVIEGRLIAVGMRALELGTNVVLDFGLWSRDERSALRQAAADVGASVVMCYFELTPDEQRKRLDQRLAQAHHATWPMSDEQLAESAAKFEIPTAAELDGSESVANRLMASRTGANGGDVGGRQQFSDSVTDHLIRPRDRWKTGPLRERPLRLFDFRVLPFVQRGYADNDNSGVRYNIYTLDYCTCVDLLVPSVALASGRGAA